MKRKKKILKVAVTGGIGSGKSAVMEILKEEQFYTISCDNVSKDMLKKRKVAKKVKKAFPFAAEGRFDIKINRRALSSAVFKDKTKLDKLNAIMHPYIIKEVMRRIKKHAEDIAFVEVPLLFEGDYKGLFDKVIVVKRDMAQRIESVKRRSGLTEEQVKARIKNQVDYDSLDLSGCTVIENDGDKLALKNKVFSAIKNLTTGNG